MTSDLLLPLFVANAVSVAFFVLALYRPDAARVIAGVGFILAGLVNFALALIDPQIYVRGFGPHAMGVYKDVIYGILAQGPGRLILAIAVWQLLVGGVTLVKRSEFVKLGCLAMTCFLVGISPLGVGSGFPSTLILAAATVVLLRQKWPSIWQVPAAKPRDTMKACGR
jgi:hypothetical protein